jgi:hypothetical protein
LQLLQKYTGCEHVNAMRLHARLAILEKRFIPIGNDTRDEVIQRALAKLTLAELKLLMEATKLQEDGREGELTAEHYAAGRRCDEFIADERTLATARS